MGFSKRYKKQQKGGGTRTGIDVKSIAAFNPATTPGLVFWIRASNPASIHRTSIAEYAAQQLPMIRINLLDQYASNPTEQVITEITSDAPGQTNSLTRVEATESLNARFPLLYEPATGEAPSIDITPPLTLMSKEAIDLPEKHTILVDGTGVSVRYNTTLDRILISGNAVDGAPTYSTDIHGKTVRVPTAHFRELLVFDRELSPEDRQRLEGYFAYQSNTQYLLPPDHPYMPDLAEDQVLAAPLGKLAPILTTIAAAKLRLEGDYKAYVAKVGQDPLAAEYNGIIAKLDEATANINRIRQALFKGVLSARAKAPGGTGYTLEEVYALVNGASLLPGGASPLGDAAIEAEVASANATLQTAKDFLPKLATADQKVAERVVAMNEEAVVAARTEAETEERLRDVEALARRREFVRTQIRIRAELDRLGDTLLNPLVEKFHTELEATREAFAFQEKEWRERLRAMESTFEPLRLLFAGEAWVQQFAEFADVGKTETGQYKTPTLQIFAEVFRSIAAAAGEGDIAYLKRQLERTARGCATVMAGWEKNRSLALFRRLYVAHVRQAYERAERWSQQLAERLGRVEGAVKQLMADMDSFRRFQEVSPFRPNFPMETFLPLEPIYVARLAPGDAALLLGYTHIRTDAAGVPRAEMNAAGDLDVEFIFPDGAAADKMSLESGYTDPKTKAPVLQHYFFVAPQAKSILDRLPPSRIPPLKPLRVESTGGALELSRDLVNTVVQVSTEGAVQPLSLPKYAVPDASFFCIQNVGADPLWVRNPGAVDDILDLVGPGEVGVYMYGEGTSLSSTPGFAYGHQVWQEGRLPYDTLLRSPRSAYSVYVKELKAAIYCLPTGNVPTALVDADGYFVPVRSAPDGNVYDADDFALSNPYAVRTLPEVGLAGLAFDRLTAKGQVRPAGPPPKISAMRDSKTGAVILGGRPGIPAADEFGIGKFVLGPILWSGGAAKCKGSGEDLELEFGDGAAQPFLFPQGLTFHRLFRSQFCRPFRLEGGALAPVFTTAQEIPLVGPSGEFILIPPNSALAGANDLFVYAEPAGTMNQIFLLSKDKPFTEGKASHVRFVETEAATHNTAIERKARSIMTRFISGFEYSKGTPKRLQETAARLAALGEAITESVRSAIADTVGMVEERLKTFTEFEGMIERVQRAMKDGEVPTEVVMSLGVLELKLRDKMMEIMELVAAVQPSVENFTFLLDRRDAAKKFVERMRNLGDDVFKRGYAAIQYLYRVHLEHTKSISSPEIDATMAQLKTTEVAFKTKQTDLEARLGDQPDTVAELREWLLDLQERAGKQFTELQEAENLVILQLVAKMKGAEEADVAAAKKELEALRAQAEEMRAAGRRYADLFEVRDAPSGLAEVGAASAAGGPFAHLKSPSIEKDLLSVVGKEAVAGMERQGADIAVLWGQLNRQSVATETGGDATAVKAAVVAGREAVEAMQSALKEMETRMKVPFEIYANAAITTVATQRQTVQALLQKARGAAAELDTQRLAIAAATQSLGDTVTEEERGKLKTIQDEVAAVAATFTADGLQAQAEGVAAEMNPFKIRPTIQELEANVAAGEAALEKMKEPIQRFQEFRAGLTERLRATFEERRKALQAEFDSMKALSGEPKPDVTQAFQVALALNPTDLLGLLDAIGEMGRVAALKP